MRYRPLWIGYGLLCLICLHPLRATAQNAAGPESNYEIVFWQSIQDSESIEMYRLYLEKYPDGHFVPLARIKIQSLSRKAALPQKPVAATPAESGGRVRLRRKPSKLHDRDIRELLLKHNFSVPNGNPGGKFENAFTDNGDGTVTDGATGLVWQAGHSTMFTKWRADQYIDKLNRDRFGGRTGWRLPTLEELSSLMELKPQQSQWLHLNPLFHDTPPAPAADIFWTSDESIGDNGCYQGNWVVNFWHGSIVTAGWGEQQCISGPEALDAAHYVRAVCSQP